MPADPELAPRALQAHETLLDVFGVPEWRNPLPPLDELVSTILSQNTTDSNRDLAYFALKARYSDWESVRDAPVAEIIDTIRPAGLANQKGPRIQQVLAQITQMRGELSLDFLKQYSANAAREWLTQFKGVGPKTAAIVLQFSLDIPAFPVDTHVFRVTGRIGLRPDHMSAEKSHDHFEKLMPPETFYTAHLNFIRLGREICKARNPQCPHCPLQGLCDYYAIHYDAEGNLIESY